MDERSCRVCRVDRRVRKDGRFLRHAIWAEGEKYLCPGSDRRFDDPALNRLAVSVHVDIAQQNINHLETGIHLKKLLLQQQYQILAAAEERLHKYDQSVSGQAAQPHERPKVEITVYRNHLVITTNEVERDHPDFTPAGEGRFGCVLVDTEKNLGVSQEAFQWLQGVPPSKDDIGEVMWFDVMAGKRAFGWIGGPFQILKPETTSGQRGYRASLDYVLILNQPPEEAIHAINDSLPSVP